VDASKPVARRLGPFLKQARQLASDAKPTVADLRKVIRRPGGGNDTVEFFRSIPPLADIAVDSERRTLAPGGREEDVGETRGAFPESVDAFEGSTPIIADGRPYTSDLFGWFDDFSTTGPGFDALGANARAFIGFSETLGLTVDGSPTLPIVGGGPVFQGRFRPCPGGAEEAAPDGSNVLSPAEQEALDCTEEDRHVGP
jgi:phospholipid/cholesterol/gamma-HCH transport system substrate-binding protein